VGLGSTFPLKHIGWQTFPLPGRVGTEAPHTIYDK
jgi:hypothetical protein